MSRCAVDESKNNSVAFYTENPANSFPEIHQEKQAFIHLLVQ
jgi:hypothetical protein